ncbi:MAG: TetR family transcriptional regulator C-terminal domain-containing protein [Kiloniellales bacterium]|nr:TetR family transcriptional regulator C-terminal domain-containing protein [Kiloniellales bacterium]
MSDRSARATRTRKRTRIQVVNEEKILEAALAVFARYGFKGAAIDQIAAAAGMSKPNLLYYFRSKKALYIAVLRRTLEMWLQPLEAIAAEDDPEAEIRAYIARKVAFSRTHAVESRLFAMEIIQGAPILKEILETRLRDLVDDKVRVIEAWVAAGKIAPVDPHHLIFTLWASTQHYADFDAQIRALLGAGADDFLLTADSALSDLLLKGLLPRRS